MAPAPQRGRSAAPPPVLVTGVGLVTPVGRDAPSTTAAVRAGVSFLRTIPDFVTPDGAEATGGLAVGLTDDRGGSDRLLSMGVPALQEALEQAEGAADDLDLARASFLLGLAPAGRPAFERFDAQDVASLLEGAGCVELARTQRLELGHTAALRGVAAAMDLLRDPAVSCCIVGGVDSLLDFPALTWLDEAGRLKTDARGHGFVPGEGAGFVVLERPADADARGARPLAAIVAAEFGEEPHPLGGSTPSRAEGLVDALRAVTATAPAAIQAVLCDLNGELYRMREWAIARSRALPHLRDDALLWHPADCFGDLGAASGAALAGIAVTGLARGWLPGPILLSCSADEGDRAALLVTGGAP